MAERLDITEKRIGLNREMVTPIDELRAADQAVGTLGSGALSGYGLTLRAVSSQVKMRTLNVEVFNREAGWVEIAFFDGGEGGSRVLGPYRINPLSERALVDSIKGSYFTSSIYVTLQSGWTGQPLSNGVRINVRWANEPLDLYGE